MVRLTKNYVDIMEDLCKKVKDTKIEPALFDRFDVKRGLRNNDGTGVVAGITNICCVHGYLMNEGEREPIPGELIYRGYNINDITNSCISAKRFGFEEVIYLLLFGELPTPETLDIFSHVLQELRHLPDDFVEDMIIKAPSPNIMNKLARSVLALYSYDTDVENATIEKELAIAMSLIAKMPNIMVNAYQVKRRHYDGQTMYFHPLRDNDSIAESILSLLRPDREYTQEEALLLDLCLMLHAEHGGGNNSTFACRVLSSSGTDAYSAFSGAIGALKGPKHGGANIKVCQMVDSIKRDVEDWNDPDQVAAYLEKILDKQANDGSGLIYGMGHAVYTISDPRALILRDHAWKQVENTEFEKEFKLLRLIETLTPEIYARKKGNNKEMCANVDLYSGLVYKSLHIPVDLFTPLFAVSRMPGWAAHRIEEITTGNRIIRPAYKTVTKTKAYVPLNERIK